jgi:hypothetical protein
VSHLRCPFTECPSARQRIPLSPAQLDRHLWRAHGLSAERLIEATEVAEAAALFRRCGSARCSCGCSLILHEDPEEQSGACIAPGCSCEGYVTAGE